MCVLFLSAAYRASAYDLLVASGSGFNTYISLNHDIAFQSDYTFTFHVESGELNGTNCGLSLYSNHGSFSFYSNNVTTLHAYTLDRDDVMFVSEGATYTGTNSSFTVSVPASTTVTLAWDYYIESYVDKYTVLAMGLGGIFLMIFSPTWVAWKARKEGASVGTVERFGYGMLLFIIGFGLVITWLLWV